MNPRVQNKRLKRIENRPHYRSKNEQEKLDKLIFNQYKDYTYSYKFLNKFEEIFVNEGYYYSSYYSDFACEHGFATNTAVSDTAFILKFLKENLKAFQDTNELAVSVHYSNNYLINKALNDQAFAYLDQLSSKKINQYANTFIIPLTQAFTEDREKTNNQEFDDLLNCLVQVGIYHDSNDFDEIVEQSWKQIVDEHNQKLKQR